MPKLIFVVDESGAKGYADKPEQMPGELGVMSGFFIPEESLQRVRQDLDQLCSKYKPAGKLHITDLNSEEQQLLRNDVFEYLRTVHGIWAYEAMYVQGFFEHELQVKKLGLEVKATRRSNIKLSNHEKVDLLHTKLFFGIFGKAVAFGLEHVGPTLHIDVVTDRVDQSILKSFEKMAERFLTIGKPKVYIATGFDTDLKKIVRASVTTQVVDGLEALGDVSKITYSIRTEDSSLTLVADVLANSVHHHLKLAQCETLGCALNSQAAISGHPLSDLAYAVSTGAQDLQIPDTIFRHPHSAPK